MYLRELRRLEDQIREQRRKVAGDQARVKEAVSKVPREIMQALGSREGLIISFSAGAAAAGLSPGTGVLSIALLDTFTRLALAELPRVGDLIRERWRTREAANEPAA